VHEAAKAFAIRAPSQIGARIERSLARLSKQVVPREDASDDASERDLAHRKPRFTRATPHTLIGVGEQRVDDVGKPRALVRAVLVGQLFQFLLWRECHVRAS
jgi:hypothetical protein